MEARDEGRTARYRLGGKVHPIQARLAWEDPAAWTRGVLVSSNGDTVTVSFDADHNPDSDQGVAAESQGDAEHGYARGGFEISEASIENLPIGDVVWVTERWHVLAFADEHGNAIALRPQPEMNGSLFARVGADRLRFLLANIAEEPSEEEENSGDLVYATIEGLDGVERFSIVQRTDAEYGAEIADVINSCTTWGDVRQMASPRLWGDLLGRMGYGDIEEFTRDLSIGNPVPGAEAYAAQRYVELDHSSLPDDDEPFESITIAGFQDGDYPPATEFLQEALLPRHLADEFGHRYDTIFNGTFLELSPESGPPIVAAMEKLGYRCVEAPKLFYAGFLL